MRCTHRFGLSLAGLLLSALALPGCAAVSLFSHQHEHTHHHHYDSQSKEILTRLESIDHRVGSLEGGQPPVGTPYLPPLP